MVVGPFNKTEFFVGAGTGMHSNDARGATITEDPTDPATKLSASPLLVRTEGAEVGVRSKIIPGLDTSLSFFVLDQASEIVFNGDAGDTFGQPAEPASRDRMDEQISPKLLADRRWRPGAVSRAICRLRRRAGRTLCVSGRISAGADRQCPGNYIPNAPAVVASAGITVGEKTGWFGTLRWRYLGSSPLTEDNAFRSPATSVFNGRIGYQHENGWSIHLDLLNLFNTRANQITYAYGSLIKTDSLYNSCFPVQLVPAAVCQNGVMDYVLHPIEPLAVRLTVAGQF